MRVAFLAVIVACCAVALVHGVPLVDRLKRLKRSKQIAGCPWAFTSAGLQSAVSSGAFGVSVTKFNTLKHAAFAEINALMDNPNVVDEYKMWKANELLVALKAYVVPNKQKQETQIRQIANLMQACVDGMRSTLKAELHNDPLTFLTTHRWYITESSSHPPASQYDKKVYASPDGIAPPVEGAKEDQNTCGELKLTVWTPKDASWVGLSLDPAQVGSTSKLNANAGHALPLVATAKPEPNVPEAAFVQFFASECSGMVIKAGKNLVLTSEMGGCAVYIALDRTGAEGPLFIHANANSVGTGSADPANIKAKDECARQILHMHPNYVPYVKMTPALYGRVDNVPVSTFGVRNPVANTWTWRAIRPKGDGLGMGAYNFVAWTMANPLVSQC